MKSQIRGAIESKLGAWAAARAPALAIGWENVAFVPPAPPYLRGFLMTAEPQNPALGVSLQRHTGIYQVSVYGPEGEGAGATERLAGEIAELFRRGAGAHDAAGTIQVLFERTPAIGPSQSQNDGTFFLPVSIRYRADAFV
jgi:hypothetical protein